MFGSWPVPCPDCGEYRRPGKEHICDEATQDAYTKIQFEKEVNSLCVILWATDWEKALREWMDSKEGQFEQWAAEQDRKEEQSE